MSRYILTLLLIDLSWSQCDFNSDGQLDSLDIADEVNCILVNCFDGSQCDFNSDGSINIFDICATVDCIKTNENPDFILVSGDISEDGTKKSYVAYQKGIERFEKPVFTILGNHDNHKNFHAVFGTKFPSVEKITLSESWLIITIDSTSMNKESGHITKQQMHSLRKLIANNKDKSLVICLHHQPIKMLMAIHIV